MKLLHCDEDDLSEEGNPHQRQWRKVGAMSATTVRDVQFVNACWLCFE
jgi:hypothetical protein